MGATAVKSLSAVPWVWIRDCSLSNHWPFRYDRHLLNKVHLLLWCINAWVAERGHLRHDATAHQYARLLIPNICQESSSKGEKERDRERERGRNGWKEEKGNRRTDRSFCENNRMNWGGWCYSWPTAFDRLVQSGDQMVLLEQSSNFSVSWRSCQQKNAFFAFLKAQFPVSLGHRRQLFSSNSSSVRCLWRLGKLFVGRPLVASSLNDMGALSCGWLSGILQRGTDWLTTWGLTLIICCSHE